MTTLRRSWLVLVVAGILSPLCTAIAQVPATDMPAARPIGSLPPWARGNRARCV